MLAVLGPVALHDLPLAVVPLDGEADAQDVVARLDDAQDAAHAVPLLLRGLAVPELLHQLVLHDGGAAVEEALHHAEEVGVVVVVPVHGLAVAADPQQGGGRRQRGGAAAQELTDGAGTGLRCETESWSWSWSWSWGGGKRLDGTERTSRVAVSLPFARMTAAAVHARLFLVLKGGTRRRRLALLKVSLLDVLD